MLDYLRNLTKSAEEKRQEMLTAYLDGALSPKQQQQVESDLAQDEGMTAELDQMRLLQQQMRQLPLRRVRRNFTLDPALYGRPQREPLVQAYPALRTATVLAAFLFIFVLATNVFQSGTSATMSDAEPMAMMAESDEELIAEAVVEEAAAESAPMYAEATEEAEGEPLIAEEMIVDPEFAMPADEAAPEIQRDMEAEAVEEAAEEPLIEEEIIVNPEFAMPAEEAASEIQRDMEAGAAAPMDDAEPAEKSEAESLAEEKAMIVVPTMAAERTAAAEQAAELKAVETAAAVESAVLPESRSPAVTGEGEESATITRETQAQRDEGLILGNSLGLIALLLGIIFVVLIILTLLARRRL